MVTGFRNFLFLLGNVLVALSHAAHEYGFWDDVRADNETQVVASSENLFLVESTNVDSSIRLAELKVLLPLSVNDDDGKNVWRPGMLEDMYAALLAQQEWNAKGYMRESDCNLRLTMEFLDSQSSPIATTKAFTNLQQQNSSLQVSAPTAVVGAFRSSVTAPLALLSGLNDIPQVSHASTSSDFDVKGLFPTFGRTVTNSAGEAAVALDYFRSIGSTHIAVVYVTDSFGSALQKAFSEAAAELDIEVLSFTVSSQVDKEGATSVMAQLLDAGYRHIYAIVYDRYLPLLLEAAGDMNLNTGDYFWFFPGLDLETLLHGDMSRSLAKSLDGAAIISMQAAVMSDTLYVGQQAVVETPTFINEHREHASFRELWQDKQKDEKFNTYVESKIPLTMNPSRITGNETYLFTGADVMDQFRDLDLQGVSGHLLFGKDTGTRDYQTINFVIWNARVTEDPDRPLSLVPSLQYRKGAWEGIDGNQFLYHGGRIGHPSDLPSLEASTNVISSATRTIGFVLMSITGASCLIGLCWVLYCWKDNVVLSSKRGFLLQILAGTLFMALTTLPLSQDETTLEDQQGLDFTCKLSPWLYIMGSSLVIGGLLAKILAIRYACINTDVETVELTSWALAGTTLGLLLANAIILLVWTFQYPLEWTRTLKSKQDQFNRLAESYASCESEHQTLFVVTLCAINILVVSSALIVLFRSTAIVLEHHEIRYLGFSVAAFFQAWCMGALIVSVVQGNPEGRFLVQIGIIFVTAQSVVSLIYRTQNGQQTDRGHLGQTDRPWVLAK